jgi:Na+-transporting methylmalonyl-CoA/oxaloacetate decarboxylase gamma subunit
VNPTEHALWVSVIIVGFVVVLAVAALLSLLIYLIKRIGRRVDTINATLTAAKANTVSTALIPQVAAGVDAVLAEGLEHHLFLGRVLGKVKS